MSSDPLLSTFAIRAAEPDDLDDIVDFQIRMALETEDKQLERPLVEKGVNAVLENPLLGHYVICESLDEHLNEVVGCLLITYEWSEWRNGLIYWIQSVYVIPEFRKQRAFTKMYQHVQNAAMADSRVCGLRLYVANDNQPAQNTYAKLGMKDGNYKVFEWMKNSDS